MSLPRDDNDSIRIELLMQVDDEVVSAFQRLMPQLTRLPAPTLAELEAIVASDTTRLFVARSADGEIVGSATLATYRTPTGLHAWIEDVVVDAAQRGQGIGRRLSMAAIQQAMLMGARTLSLTSRPERVAANRLYQRLGFVQWHTNLYRYPMEE